jgi:hypothetical protein
MAGRSHHITTPAPARCGRQTVAEQKTQFKAQCATFITTYEERHNTHRASTFDHRATTRVLLRAFHWVDRWPSKQLQQDNLISSAINKPPLVVNSLTLGALTPDKLIDELDRAVVRLILTHRQRNTRPCTIPVAPVAKSFSHARATQALAEALLRRHNLLHRLGDLIVANDEDSRLIVVGTRPQRVLPAV